MSYFGQYSLPWHYIERKVTVDSLHPHSTTWEERMPLSRNGHIIRPSVGTMAHLGVDTFVPCKNSLSENKISNTEERLTSDNIKIT